MPSNHDLGAAICSRSSSDSLGSKLRKMQERDNPPKKDTLVEEVGVKKADRIRAAHTRLSRFIETSRRSIGRNLREELKSILSMISV